ncbi:MAG: hypothetical protein K6T65_10385 [Peptococcaceae bacterium]|nr:hypothetical protein [Peptococcaceae bacterium]
MKKSIITLLAVLSLFAFVLPVYAGDSDDVPMDSFVNYQNGALYVFHFCKSDPVYVHIPPEIKVTGQVVEASVKEAKFKPANNGDYRFQEKHGEYSFDLLVAYLEGKGDVTCKVGDKEWAIPVDSREGQLNVKLPDFRIDYNLPYTLSATGNIELAKTFSGESPLGYAHRDVWQYTADGGILDGTMMLHYTISPGEGRGPTFTFPFCPASAYYWLQKPQPEPYKTPLPEPDPGSPGASPDNGRYLLLLVPAAAAVLFLLPFIRAVNVSVEVKPNGNEAQALVYRDARGPKRVIVVLSVNDILRQFILAHNETHTVDIEKTGHIIAAVKTPGRRNVSKKTRAELFVKE